MISTPAAQPGAPCGIVDTLDFPLSPPDGDGVGGGRDFGVFRRQYDSYHAGEDWWIGFGRSSLGEPVYSIGHGTITYAEPLGWGRDQGVVIVRHIFADGSTILSFYGHLDPPSVTLRAGDCVRRGEKVGEIGNPRTAPHLHFEIRSHLPTEPGGGYWAEDPTLAGWEAPSPYIWNYRMAGEPGVHWLTSFDTLHTQIVGIYSQSLLLAAAGSELLALDLLDGREVRLFTGEDGLGVFASAMLAPSGDRLYTTTRGGRLNAYSVSWNSADRKTAALTEQWEVELDVRGVPRLMPLPEGGVVLSASGNYAAVDANGSLLWTQEIAERPLDWLQTGSSLLLTTERRNSNLWQLSAAGAVMLPDTPSGYLAGSGDQVWLYNQDGVYLVEPGAGTATRVYALPLGYPDRGDVAVLPDGGLIVAHADPTDRRLVLLNADGSVRWQRSYSRITAGDVRILIDGDQILLAAKSGRGGNSNKVMLYGVDAETALLTRIFTGGSRSLLPGDTWLLATGTQQILLSLGNGTMVAIDPTAAGRAVSAGNQP